LDAPHLLTFFNRDNKCFAISVTQMLLSVPSLADDCRTVSNEDDCRQPLLVKPKNILEGEEEEAKEKVPKPPPPSYSLNLMRAYVRMRDARTQRRL